MFGMVGCDCEALRFATSLRKAREHLLAIARTHCEALRFATSLRTGRHDGGNHAVFIAKLYASQLH